MNKRAASAKFKAEDILRTLAIKPTEIIADVGSGGGFFVFTFAKITAPNGQVYAVDTNEENLSFIQEQTAIMKLDNVFTHLTTEDHLVLPDKKFDLIFMRNMFHHLHDPLAYFAALVKHLKPAGRVAVIDYKKPSGFSLSFSSLFHHYSDPSLIAETMQKAGLNLPAAYDFLPDQSFQIFTHKK